MVIDQDTAAAALVRSYLEAMEARDLPRARALVGKGFTMTFPGGAVMQTLEELIEWSRPRYARVGKHFDGFDVVADVVWVRGTLHGQWLDGTSFEGIRFVDRFEINDGKLTRQEVWNDMGEARNGRD